MTIDMKSGLEKSTDIFHANELIFKSDLFIYQSAAEGLVQEGFKPFNYSVAEEQVHPDTGEPLDKDSRLLVVSYTGLKNRDKLLDIVHDARTVKRKLESKSKSVDEVQRIVKSAVGDFIQLARDWEERESKFNLANTLAVIAHDQRNTAMACSALVEDWRTLDLVRSSSRLLKVSEALHSEIGDLNRKDNEIRRRLSKL